LEARGIQAEVTGYLSKMRQVLPQWLGKIHDQVTTLLPNTMML
jgi:hypothetical protein